MAQLRINPGNDNIPSSGSLVLHNNKVSVGDGVTQVSSLSSILFTDNFEVRDALDAGERTAITDGIVGTTRVIQNDLIGIIWTLIAKPESSDDSWIGQPYTVDPDGDIIVNMELADVSEIVPDANVLGQVGGRPTIGDDVTTGGKRLAMTDDLLNLTLLVDTADAVTGFALDAIPDDWKSGVTTITAAHIGQGVTTLGAGAFAGCSNLASVTLPDSLTIINDGNYDNGAFAFCSGLTSITIPNSVTSIGSYAFYSCTSLTSVTIGNSVTTIGSYAFDGCSALTSVTIGNSVTTIGSYAFYGCTSLTSITITSVPAAAWTGLNGLNNTTLLTDINITADVFAQYDGAWRTAQSVDPSVTLNSI